MISSLNDELMTVPILKGEHVKVPILKDESLTVPSRQMSIRLSQALKMIVETVPSLKDECD